MKPEAFYRLPEGGYVLAKDYPAGLNPMDVPLNRARMRVCNLVVNARAALTECCHTSAYTIFHDLDKAIAELLAMPSFSDYGHSRWLLDRLKEIDDCDLLQRLAASSAIVVDPRISSAGDRVAPELLLKELRAFASP